MFSSNHEIYKVESHVNGSIDRCNRRADFEMATSTPPPPSTQDNPQEIWMEKTCRFCSCPLEGFYSPGAGASCRDCFQARRTALTTEIHEVDDPISEVDEFSFSFDSPLCSSTSSSPLLSTSFPEDSLESEDAYFERHALYASGMLLPFTEQQTETATGQSPPPSLSPRTPPPPAH